VTPHSSGGQAVEIREALGGKRANNVSLTSIIAKPESPRQSPIKFKRPEASLASGR
jgi:hypothetical protein